LIVRLVSGSAISSGPFSTTNFSFLGSFFTFLLAVALAVAVAVALAVAVAVAAIGVGATFPGMLLETVFLSF